MTAWPLHLSNCDDNKKQTKQWNSLAVVTNEKFVTDLFFKFLQEDSFSKC